MEFPPEIVDLIRQYYQPCFKYFREYKRTLKMCAFHRWDELKEALQNRTEKVLLAIRAHEEAQTIWLKEYYANLVRAEKYPQDYYDKLRTCDVTYSELVKSIN